MDRFSSSHVTTGRLGVASGISCVVARSKREGFLPRGQIRREFVPKCEKSAGISFATQDRAIEVRTQERKRRRRSREHRAREGEGIRGQRAREEEGSPGRTAREGEGGMRARDARGRGGMRARDARAGAERARRSRAGAESGSRGGPRAHQRGGSTGASGSGIRRSKKRPLPGPKPRQRAPCARKRVQPRERRDVNLPSGT